jgi:HD-like signal output (HDOD) protein
MVDETCTKQPPGGVGVASLSARLATLQALPPLPHSARQLLQVLVYPDLDLLRLASLIEHSPALSARIMGVANSAFFASRAPARDVPDAIIRILGLDLVRDLSISLLLGQPFDLSACPRFDARRYWSDAMACATFADIVASHLGSADLSPSTAYLSGLIRNLGLVALVHLAPREMDDVFAAAATGPAGSLRAIERQRLGVDHAAAGAALAQAWQLPLDLARPLAVDRDRAENDDAALLSQLLCACPVARLDNGPGFGDPATEHRLRALGIPAADRERLAQTWREGLADIEPIAASLAGGGR